MKCTTFATHRGIRAKFEKKILFSSHAHYNVRAYFSIEKQKCSEWFVVFLLWHKIMWHAINQSRNGTFCHAFLSKTTGKIDIPSVSLSIRPSAPAAVRRKTDIAWVCVMRLRGKTNRKYAPLFGRVLNIHSTAIPTSYNHPFFVAPFIITLQINSNLYYHHATRDDKKSAEYEKKEERWTGCSFLECRPWPPQRWWCVCYLLKRVLFEFYEP